MPRYDKYDPYVGGFRAPLDAAISADDGFTAFGVGINADGHVVLGGGATGVTGVLIAHGAKKAGAIVDVMTSGEIVEWTADGSPDGADADAGDLFFATADDGAVGTTGDKCVGFTVEGTRLVVRFAAGVLNDADTTGGV